MSATSASVDIEGGSEGAPGQLLRELERRQDQVLSQLDMLNAEVEAVLGNLGVQIDAEPSLEGDAEAA